MGKLHFHYAAMGSSKSASLLMFDFNLREVGFKTLLLSSALDDRSGANKIKSRIGLEAPCLSVKPRDNILKIFQKYHSEKIKIDYILFDEVQFASIKQIDQLATIVDMYGVNVHAYGLRTDFKMKFFPASMRLMEVAETISENEIKTMCSCGEKATVNARFIDNKVVRIGAQIMTGDTKEDEKRVFYKPLCRKCWYSR